MSRFPLVLISAILGFCGPLRGLAQVNAPETSLPQKLSPAEGAKEGAALVANLLSETPETSLTNHIVLWVENPSGAENKVSARFIVLANANHSTNIYETVSGGPSMKVMIVRPPDARIKFFLSQPATAPPKPISGNETMIPFAASDFWVADLGLEFLQWPKQVVTRKEMRRGQFCAVLESVNPKPAQGAYSRVVSWIAINRPGVAIVHADAFDSNNQLLKQFDPKKFEKVNGQWQLDQMEIRNRQTGSRTRIDLNPGE